MATPNQGIAKGYQNLTKVLLFELTIYLMTTNQVKRPPTHSITNSYLQIQHIPTPSSTLPIYNPDLNLIQPY